MNFLRFLVSKLFFRHLGVAVGLGVIALIVVLLWLRFYTHHGRTIMVPDLAGLSLEEVDDVCSSRNLRFEVIDSVFSSAMPRGTVIKQNPLASSQVKRNRKIFLTMNAINPEKVNMPQLVGLSIRQARLALQNAGLILGEIKYRPDFAVNNVLQQMHADSVIHEGMEIRKGEVIDLVLGMVSSKTTRVPELIGKGLDESREIVTDYYLNMGAITYDGSVEGEEDSAMAFIWRQYPVYDDLKRLRMGSEVDVWLTIDSTLLPLPDTLVTELESDLINE